MSKLSNEQDYTELLNKLAESLNGTQAEIEATFEIFKNLNLDISPKAELLHRLNMIVKNQDPGEPYNWRGVRGFYLG
ncbi:hypothetical protein SEA_THUNDERCLAP_49 [Arthrobacter phage Thunderclap]|uniref:Uncharacterized protein n=6 Tax=Amigovirus amigo TaxID=1982100 RepID=A0A5J6TBP2_9CAUD|nr:hypothetical protein FDH66_gp54 [Arthrobacter phage Amigo]QFG08343.1 hypothetical protein SEA_YEEZUS_49 [Arthrobacter phage Yeezus]QFG13391.1 hypothetical protein SEA_ICHOR_49 [Arthrobacter phage Ichor]QFG13909.1 hypothetical protein SEA_JAEK_49 [Arthrobacter phage Jaek]QJD51696.1 hypothetical protein SEA_BOERSMA_51 [Arthrobacter phage Boersma]QOR56104.1 hypothetical protein SEA_THUNDERCLAP_49 [Arthrobacter phage Thunderclap]